jgi:outer membrane protein with beta-barrel domain
MGVCAALAAAGLLSAPALAQTPSDPYVPDATGLGASGVGSPPPERSADTYTPQNARIGAGILLGGGFEDFTDRNLRAMTSGGGYWNLRLLAGNRRSIGVEGSYTGAMRSINALGLGSKAMLMSNGVEATARINLPIVKGLSLIEPFVFGGLGWQRYSVTNTSTNTSDLANSDDVLSLPLGAGFEYAFGMFLVDARVTYRRTFFNDLLRTTEGNQTSVGLGAQLGLMF